MTHDPNLVAPADNNFAIPTLSVGLPDSFLSRNVWFRVGKQGSRWTIEAEDRNGYLFDVRFDGYTGVIKFSTKTGAIQMLDRYGYAPGDTFWAVPQKMVDHSKAAA